MFIYNIRNKAIHSQCCLVSTMNKNVIYAIIAKESPDTISDIKHIGCGI